MMLANKRQIIDKFAADLKSDVIPIDILPYLLCLTDDDCEQIEHKQDREGPRAAVPTLLSKLKRRTGAFEQFLEGLGRTGCCHLKTSLEKALSGKLCFTGFTLPKDSEHVKTKAFRYRRGRIGVGLLSGLQFYVQGVFLYDHFQST